MILDSLAHAGRYISLHPDFSRVFSFLKSGTPQLSGRITLNGDDAFVLYSQATGKLASDAFLESHRRYIDVHVCFAGVEQIGWRMVADCSQIDQPYNEEKDMMTFSDLPTSWVTLVPGSFAIFFPEDAHAPMVSESVVHKAVVKVHVAR
jgi:biofilm protein TabA